MHDNKVRLSRDVLEKAEIIAREWGLKNARAAVEAVFRRYSDDYLSRHHGAEEGEPTQVSIMPRPLASGGRSAAATHACEALDALDDVLAL